MKKWKKKMIKWLEEKERMIRGNERILQKFETIKEDIKRINNQLNLLLINIYSNNKSLFDSLQENLDNYKIIKW